MMPPKNAEIYQFLLQRRSASILNEPKPSREELEKILAHWLSKV